MTDHGSGHARHRLDPQLNSPVRVSILAALVGVDDIEFAGLRDAVELSDSALSKHLAVLEGCGYVRLHKGYVGKRPRTWVSSTDTGRKAFEVHVAALQDVVRGAEHDRPRTPNPYIQRDEAPGP